MRGWAEAQRSGEFFVLVQEALREAAYHVAETLRDDAPQFAPLTGDQLAISLQSSLGASVIRFLHGLEPVPDALMARGTREFRSSAGQWFAEAYALGVAQAIREAGNRVVERLRSS
jgi:hypothetical protein